MKYIAPTIDSERFTCPHCQTLSQHKWTNDGGSLRQMQGIDDKNIVYVSTCGTCGHKTIWIDDKMVYPQILAIEPNPDMPSCVLSLYNEAGEIYTKSPRAACALLRLAIERLCNELVGEDTIDKNIDKLVKEGLPLKIQQALDFVRIIGNKAVHPAQIALDVDNVDTAKTLFELLNIITSNMITEKNRIEELFNLLPESAKKAIDRRDK